MESWALIKINRIVYIMNTIICGALAVGYMMDLLKGRKTLGFIIIFFVFLTLQLVICSMKFIHNKESIYFKYYSLAGFACIYCFAIFSSDTYFTYVYIFPIIIPYVLYHNAKLIKNLGIVIIILNIAKVLFQIYQGHNTDDDITSYTVQMAAVILVSILLYSGTNIMVNVSNEKIDKVVEYSRILEESANNLNESIGEQVQKTQDIVNFSNNIKHLSEEMIEMSKKVSTKLDLEIKNLSQLQTETGKVNERSTSVYNDIKQLNGLAIDITQTVGSISSIAFNTNLLAINASIEAVRNGSESNQGFAVVAREVKNLAAQSNNSADIISMTIQELSGKISYALSDVDYLIENNASQNKVLSIVQSACADVIEQIGDLIKMIYNLDGELKNLNYANEDIVENTQRIQDIALQSQNMI